MPSKPPSSLKEKPILPSKKISPLDPTRSVWIQASAGSGKTYLLVQRILSLLLNGTPISKILCVTFTKAAAFEMKQRLLQQVQEWTFLPDTNLDVALRHFTSPANSVTQAMRLRARHLFKDILEDTHPLKIQTIHGFCQHLLTTYPLEADIRPTFHLLEEESFSVLQAEVLDALFSPSFLQNDPSFFKVLSFLLSLFSEKTFQDLVFQILINRRFFEKKSPHISPDPSSFLAFLEEGLKDLPLIPLQTWKEFLFSQDPNCKTATFLETFLSISPTERAHHFQPYALLFLTKEGNKRKNPFLKVFQKTYPSQTESLALEQDRVEVLEQQRRIAYTNFLNACFESLAHRILALYETLKKSKNLIDFEDLLLKSRYLLDNREKMPWIPYALAQGIDHILVDEVQDTNTSQWDFLFSLFETIREEKDASTAKTLFIVGDEKQSIYSFQGADLSSYAHYKEKLRSFLETTTEELVFHTLSLSFRSNNTILKTVDHIFAKEENREGVCFSENVIYHQSHRPHHFGSVELWPLLQKTKKAVTKEISPDESSFAWKFTEELQDIPLSRLMAHSIAQSISDRLKQGVFLPSQNRPLESKDILILVQRRTSFIDDLTFFLKKLNIRVQGKDRITLNDSLPIQDLIALGKWCFLESDDLLLAAVLKGPFFRFSEEALFDLSYNRQASSLYTFLQEKNPSVAAFLEKIRSLAQGNTAYIFFYILLTQFDGWSLFHAHFGPEVKGILDIFLEKLSILEKSPENSFLSCLYAIEQEKIPIRQEGAFQEGYGVRILTTHAAKGLEAPFVILADSPSLPPLSSLSILWEEDPLICPAKENRPSFIEKRLEKAREKTLEEYRRLLYVALTRAKDHLVVCGIQSGASLHNLTSSWYYLIQDTLQDVGTPYTFCFLQNTPHMWTGEGFVFKCNDSPHLLFPSSPSVSPSTTPPAWIKEKALQNFDLIKTVAPSHLLDIDIAHFSENSGSPSSHSGIWRGLLLHSLLYDLSFVDIENRPQAAKDFCRLFWESHNSSSEIDSQKEALSNDCIQRALSLFNNPILAFIFSSYSKGEVAIGGFYKSMYITGRIDRLIIDPLQKIIWIIEFKSDKKVPATLQDIPPPYKTQLEAYRALIADLYPTYILKSAFLWIETETLQELI